MKRPYLLFLMLSCNICLSQHDNITETIITTSADSVRFYMERNADSKRIGVSNFKSMRVSYVYLDGSQYTLEQIDVIRRNIISDYKKGRSFADMANRYTMDAAKDGDLGWFDEGVMVKVFEDEIKSHKKGDIFTVDIPDRKWYYVVLKTFDDVKKFRIEIEKY
jgi:hypothetical protein